MIDLFIVLAYFVLIFVLALRGTSQEGEETIASYFLSSRQLRWPSIALSTIATNINGYQFLGMMGSAYLYGLAQASLEINAIQGILLAAFIFVPIYLSEKITTITEFINRRLGRRIGLFYSLANIVLFSTITIGAALFWGAYAIELVFSEYLGFLSAHRIHRIAALVVTLGIFSASYTYLGGLRAVVRTDILQFFILLLGGIIIVIVMLNALGGWSQLYAKTPDLMHLHLPAEHPVLPWTHMFGLFFLNINYWCANQTIMQRSLAAKNLQHAQIGLLVGGVAKYAMAIVIIIPGIALVGILAENGLADPDMAFPYIVQHFLPSGLRGIILCALMASLMSTVDSTFNSLATLWSVDIYKMYIRKDANDSQVIAAGKKSIVVALISGVTMGIILLILKFDHPENAFTHTLNELRYYVNCGIVVLICTAIIMVSPHRKGTLFAFLMTVPMQIGLKHFFPEMNYFVRAGFVIIIALFVAIFFSRKNGFSSTHMLIRSSSKVVSGFAIGLLASLIIVHIIFS
ncbi:MAG: sodium/solute symporter [Saprospiraceae bacterium]|nr:sodium/solute symporter [Saprospiraceae bacterium]